VINVRAMWWNKTHEVVIHPELYGYMKLLHIPI